MACSLGGARVPEAQARLGRAALAAKDCTTAIKWVTAAARQGLPAAQFQLGSMYDHGQCIWQDFRRAAEWYSRAAEDSMPEALYHLGTLFEQGRGVPQDYFKAINLYFAAAQQGYYPAIFKMGLMFLHGRGVQKDDGWALAWFFRSDVITPPGTPQAEFIERHARAMVTAVVGQPDDPDEAGRLAEKMKPDEIRRAQRLAAMPWKGLPQPPR